jgi:hypothetical protein
MKVEPKLLKLFAEYGAVVLDPDAHGCNAPGRHFEFWNRPIKRRQEEKFSISRPPNILIIIYLRVKKIICFVFNIVNLSSN